jgi:probable O-glycosylation ligase (exosortase A-associated)
VTGRPRHLPAPPNGALLAPGANSSRIGDNAARKATALLFAGYLLAMTIEYTGIAKEVPILKTLRFTTILSYLLLVITLSRVGIGDLWAHRQTRILVGFIVFTMASIAWAIVKTNAFVQIRPLVDYTVFFVLTLSLVDRKSRIDMVSWAFVAIAIYLVALNLEKLSSSLRVGAFNAPYFMGDGNDFAWALVVMIPIILNLVLGKRGLFTRLGGIVGATACLVGIIGSSSRGATLGLAAMGAYYFFRIAKRKAGAIVLLGIAVIGVLAFAPSSYFERVSTVAHIEEDNSARTRLQAWGAAIKMSIDYPLGVGAGNFPSAYGRFYIPAGDANAMTWAAGRWINAHSIYFKVLGEYGIIGLSMLILLIVTNIRDNIAARKAIEAAPEKFAIDANWPALVTLAMIGYAVCGVFLGGINYPHIFFLSALTVLNKRLAGLPARAPKTRRPSTTHRNAPG